VGLDQAVTQRRCTTAAAISSVVAVPPRSLVLVPDARVSSSAARISVLRTLLFGLSSYLLSLKPQTPDIVQRFVDLP
jgi:hypothetical protein